MARPRYKRAVHPILLRVLRVAVLALGAAAGVVLVRALDAGLAGAPRDFGASHLAFGVLLALAVMPGPILGLFTAEASPPRLRGLAVGGSAVTAFVAALGGAMTVRALRSGRAQDAGLALVLAWCLLALPLSVVDILRLRKGGG